MIWKSIGRSSIGTSHIQSGKNCEDAISYKIINHNDSEIMLCIVSDGAGSAKYAEQGSQLVTKESIEYLSKILLEGRIINTVTILALAEHLYDQLKEKAINNEVHINEFSCTYLGCILYSDRSILFQIGDGIIVQSDEFGNYSCVWIPQNGEYSNTTNFLIDDANFGNLHVKELDNPIDEIAITTDGLQNLILKYDSNEIHQPFFTSLFKWLRMAKADKDIEILDRKLNDYLNSDLINSKTDDDKTLFLATRLIA